MLLSLYLAFMSHSHSGGLVDELFHWILRGFAWRTGTRIASSLPIGVLILIVIVVVGVWLYIHHKNKQADRDRYDR